MPHSRPVPRALASAPLAVAALLAVALPLAFVVPLAVSAAAAAAAAAVRALSTVLVTLAVRTADVDVARGLAILGFAAPPPSNARCCAANFVSRATEAETSAFPAPDAMSALQSSSAPAYRSRASRENARRISAFGLAGSTESTAVQSASASE
eukprot:scaffold254275_cov28-Tisochrysis_lutea.AAC.2